MPLGTLAATILPGLISGFTGGLLEPDSPAEIQAKLERENRTAPGFTDFGSELAKKGPNLSLQNARKGVNFGRR
jgi:hypothetical protein